ncbi:MAG: exosortase C-terminal domain/associated protein EpsI [Desulfobaccales bacterium]
MESKTTANSWLNFDVLTLVILVLGATLIYWPVLSNLMIQLANDEDFSYGLLLPLVSAYIVYLKWPELRREPWRPSWQGLAFMAPALGLYIAGKLITEFYSTRLSFFMVIAGIILLTGGWKVLRRLAFPLLLLVLMIPLPNLITSYLTVPLQLISSVLAAKFLMFLGHPVLLKGNIIDLGVRQLQVVSACSGLRYILSLLALGIIFCYFYQRRLWKAAVLLVSLVPAAILANALRVMCMGLYPALLEGFWHSFSGWLIFLFCFGLMGLLNLSLNYLQPQAAPVSPENVRSTPEEEAIGRQAFLMPYFIAGLAMIMVSGALVYTVGQPPNTPLLQSFDKFPLRLGPWEGHRDFLDPEIFEKTESDAYLDARFTAPNQPPVSLYIAYYESQNSAGSLDHNPSFCMTGSGWKTLESGTQEIGPGLPVNFLLLRQSGVTLLVYYWNMHQGQWMALKSSRGYKLYTLYNGLRLRRTDWALVRLITPVNADKKLAEKRLTDFAHSLTPVLPQFIRP